MKQKLALVLSFVVASTGAFAQSDVNAAPAKKGRLVGIHFNGLDFNTPATWKDNSTPRRTTKMSDMDFGFSLSYWKGLTNYIDYSVKLNANLHEYAGKDRNESTTKTEMGIEIEPSVYVRPFKDNNIWNPFLNVGLGAGYYTGELGAYVPTGMGLQLNFSSVSYLVIQANYRWSLMKDKLKDNLMYSVGFLHSIEKEKPKVVLPPPPPPVVDRDNDGVLDIDDKCPDTPGLVSLQGCPDRDGDGIADGDDKCPDQKGIAKYQGCPIPDTDGDGINDEDDKCPTQKGVARYQGCPIPDTDGDGVNDEEDKCPSRPGPASNQGCPEIAKEVIEKINMAAKNVFYATGSSKLLPKSFTSLNEVAKLMKADQTLMVDIDGHTDSQGTDAINQKLSNERANSVKDYLMKQGIDASRLKATGYGASKPVADNKTAAGRAQNRRTEMTVRNF